MWTMAVRRVLGPGMRPPEQAWVREREGALKARAEGTNSSCSHQLLLCLLPIPTGLCCPVCSHTLAGRGHGRVNEVSACVCMLGNRGKSSRPSAKPLPLGSPGRDRERSLLGVVLQGLHLRMQTLLGRCWSQNELLISIFTTL